MPESPYEALTRTLDALSWLFSQRAFGWLCGAVIVLAMANRSLRGVFEAWNDVRLMPAYAWLNGQGLYHLPDSGPLLNIIYGPVAPIFYLPSLLPAKLFSSLDGTFILALATNALLVFVPAVMLLRTPTLWRDADPAIARLALWAVLFHIFLAAPTSYSLHLVHVDPSALGLCALCCLFVTRHLAQPEAPTRWNLYAAGLCAALAPWAKQTAAPILIAPSLYLLWIGRRHDAARLFAATLAASLALLGAFALHFGAWPMLYSMFVLPGRQSWVLRQAAELAKPLGDALDLAALAAIALWMAASAGLVGPKAAPRPIPGGAFHAPSLLLLTALAMAPTSFLGIVKAGGGINNYCLLTYLAALALGAGILSLANSLEQRPLVRPVAVLSLGLLVAVQVGRGLPGALRIAGSVAVAMQGGFSQQAYAFAREHPETIYYPWHPMATFLADARVYPAVAALRDYERAGTPLSEQRFRNSLPRKMRYLAFRLPGHGDGFDEWLPEFRCRISLPELPGWEVYIKGPPDCQASP